MGLSIRVAQAAELHSRWACVGARAAFLAGRLLPPFCHGFLWVSCLLALGRPVKYIYSTLISNLCSRYCSFFWYCWVTLPCAPHLITCAETNGGRVKKNVYPIVVNWILTCLINVVINSVWKISYGKKRPNFTYLDKCRRQSVWKKTFTRPRDVFFSSCVWKYLINIIHRYCTYVRYPVLLNKTVQKKTVAQYVYYL